MPVGDYNLHHVHCICNYAYTSVHPCVRAFVTQFPLKLLLINWPQLNELNPFCECILYPGSEVTLELGMVVNTVS